MIERCLSQSQPWSWFVVQKTEHVNREKNFYWLAATLKPAGVQGVCNRLLFQWESVSNRQTGGTALAWSSIWASLNNHELSLEIWKFHSPELLDPGPACHHWTQFTMRVSGKLAESENKPTRVSTEIWEDQDVNPVNEVGECDEDRGVKTDRGFVHAVGAFLWIKKTLLPSVMLVLKCDVCWGRWLCSGCGLVLAFVM